MLAILLSKGIAVPDPRRKFGRQNYKDQVDLVEKFSTKLQPKPGEMNKAHQAIHQKIVLPLQHKDFPFDVDRVVIAGSAGKKTALPDSDFDLVVFINKPVAEFSEVIKYLKMKTLPGQKGVESIESTRFSVQFKLNDWDIDLLPAENFTIGKSGKSKRNQAQKSAAIQKITEQFATLSTNQFSSSLSEFAVAFVCNQTEIMRSAIRLCKFWNKMIDVEGVYVRGRSTIMEMVALEANRRKKKRSVFTCFTRFLIRMANFRELKIVFKHNYPGAMIPEDVSSQRPLILDPVNPRNNLAHGIDSDVMLKFELAARRTLEKIDKLADAIDDVESFIDPTPTKK